MNIHKKLICILRKNSPSIFSDGKMNIELHTHLQDDLMINSILFYNLLVDIENEFGISFSDVRMGSKDFASVANLEKSIVKLLEEQKRSISSNRTFFDLSNEQKGHIFLHQDGAYFTYSELWENIAYNYLLFKDKGITKEQRVPIYCKDPIALLSSLFAIILLGACGVLIENGKTEHEIDEILQQLQANTIITDTPNCQLICSSKLVSINVSSLDRFHDFPDLYHLMEEPDNDDLEACIIYTSGSTGNPKGIIRTRKIIFEHAQALAQTYGFNQDDKVLILVQPQHAFGFEHFMASIYGKSEHYAFDNFDYKKAILLIKSQKCNVVVAVPYQYEILSKSNDDYSSNNLRLCLSAGAPLREITNKNLTNRFGVPISQIYGSSELAASAVNLKPAKYASVGKTIACVQIRIVDERNEEVADGECGELTIKSPYCTQGYVNEEVTMAEDWFHTGDIGYMDEDGDIFITGRIKNIINIAGKKVSAEEVEKVIKDISGITEVLVVGEKNDIYGESIKATVVLEENLIISEEEILKHCRKYLSDYKLPTTVLFANQLERTSSGKLKR